MNTVIRVLLVEDHFLARMALRSILDGREDLRIVGEADSGEKAIALYDHLRPDVTIMDLRLPGANGFDTISAIKARHRTAKIIVLTNYEGSEDIYRALRNGAMAYLTKDVSGRELIDAILCVNRGARYLPDPVRDSLADRIPCSDLTPRESQVLKLISDGKSNREIATVLQIAEKTVRIHVSAILEKLSARDRTQAAIYAIQRGIVHFDQ